MKLTIFTPTFNRKECLKKCFDSLSNQTNKQFVWLVIDDGSNDETEQFINSLKQIATFEIRYFKKENGGKHSAYNLAVDICDTEFLLVALDSDDWLESNAVEKIYDYISDLNDDYMGVVFPKNTIGLSCNNYNLDLYKDKSLSEVSRKNLLKSECIFVFRSEYVKNYKYPIYEKEKFFTEAFTYYQMNGKMLWTDDYIYLGKYLDDGLTKNVFKLFYKYPLSWKAYNKLRMKLNCSLFMRIRYMIYYIAFSLLSKTSLYDDLSICDSLKITILLPFGFILKNILIFRGR